MNWGGNYENDNYESIISRQFKEYPGYVCRVKDTITNSFTEFSENDMITINYICNSKGFYMFGAICQH